MLSLSVGLHGCLFEERDVSELGNSLPSILTETILDPKPVSEGNDA